MWAGEWQWGAGTAGRSRAAVAHAAAGSCEPPDNVPSCIDAILCHNGTVRVAGGPGAVTSTAQRQTHTHHYHCIARPTAGGENSRVWWLVVVLMSHSHGCGLHDARIPSQHRC